MEADVPRAFCAAGVALIACLVSLPGHAWNKAGHMVSGAIAYSVLAQDDSKAAARVVQILKTHPHYPSRWAPVVAKEGGGAAAEAQHLFMLAARWADDVRGDRDYSRDELHYTNIPFAPSGVPTTPPRTPNVVSFLKALPNTFGAATTDSERAVVLCWLFHLTGDIHQPLHTISLFNQDYPKGDRGGNAIFIRVRATTSPIKLHAFWDDLILGSQSAQSARNKATELRLRPNLHRQQLPELANTSATDWAEKESYPLAIKYAYLEGALRGATASQQAAAPALPDGYVRSAVQVAETQLVLSGYRIAEQLRKLVGD